MKIMEIAPNLSVRNGISPFPEIEFSDFREMFKTLSSLTRKHDLTEIHLSLFREMFETSSFLTRNHQFAENRFFIVRENIQNIKFPNQKT